MRRAELGGVIAQDIRFRQLYFCGFNGKAEFTQRSCSKVRLKSISPLIPTTHIFFAGSGQTGNSGELSQVERRVPSGVIRW